MLVLLEGGELIAAQEEGGVSSSRSWRVGGSLGVLWSRGRGRCGAPGLLQAGGWNNDRCLLRSQSELGASVSRLG